jgi:hypothetical protein
MSENELNPDEPVTVHTTNQWMALTPPELVRAHLKLDAPTMVALRKDKQVIVRSPADRPKQDRS